jgi:hypothetical protein
MQHKWVCEGGKDVWCNSVPSYGTSVCPSSAKMSRLPHFSFTNLERRITGRDCKKKLGWGDVLRGGCNRTCESEGGVCVCVCGVCECGGECDMWDMCVSDVLRRSGTCFYHTYNWNCKDKVKVSIALAQG